MGERAEGKRRLAELLAQRHGDGPRCLDILPPSARLRPHDVPQGEDAIAEGGRHGDKLPLAASRHAHDEDEGRHLPTSQYRKERDGMLMYERVYLISLLCRGLAGVAGHGVGKPALPGVEGERV